ncbi:MAG TPA: protein kinase [Thermoanaerobaculia bacterium]|nr:protein kinase [Thermoanaerobaculia bacterium]
MTLPAGSRLGPYEILAPLGAGGMGEVYRAKDPRLGREVAIKVLPASFSSDADRLRRFEQEARAAGLLNHPNITAVYDIGTHEGAPYVVQELLEGETLRAELADGRFSSRKAIEYAQQIAQGLAAAHEKGIVHRDLKPENLFVTRDGRVKILDFGLAKLTEAEPGGQATSLPTATAGTEPGVVMGTLGYMSPEQVKGKAADARSDIFAFGAVLYEMLSGKRAFHGESAAETMASILREDPPELSVTGQNISPGLERIVRHCLEKNPERRFQSASDIAFDLETLSGLSGPMATPARAPGKKWGRPSSLLGAALLGGLVVGAIVYLAGARMGSRLPPSFQQLTYRHGTVWSARFGSDGKSIFYSASWDGHPTEIFVSSPESPESRPFGLSGADVLAISASGELAVGLASTVSGEFLKTATLARTSATGGGAPRQMLEDVQFADWSPDGKELAIVRAAGGRTRLEYPIGKALYETGGWIGNPRVSPLGDRVAFIDHPVGGDDGGSVAAVDRTGKKTNLSELFGSIQGLAWSPDGSEIWFTAALASRALYGVSPAGKQRLIARVTGSLTLQDTSRDGRVLLTDELRRVGLSVLAPGDGKEKDLSWLDWSRPAGLSADGKTVLFFESGAGGGPGYSVYLRGTDGGPAVRLGEGTALSLSPDGKWALALLHKFTNPEVVLYPTGAGQPRPLPLGSLKPQTGRFLPDGRRILIVATEPRRATRIYLTDVQGTKPQALTDENYRGPTFTSSDGTRFLVRGPDETTSAYSFETRGLTPIPAIQPNEIVAGWTADGTGLYVQGPGIPAPIDRLDLATGRRERWKEIAPSDVAGVVRISSFVISPDGRFYTYAYSRVLSNLYLAGNLK